MPAAARRQSESVSDVEWADGLFDEELITGYRSAHELRHQRFKAETGALCV